MPASAAVEAQPRAEAAAQQPQPQQRGSYARWVAANKAAAPAAPPAIVTSEAPAAADGGDDAWADAGDAADATFDEHDDVEGFAFELLSAPEAASESGAPSRALFARKGDHVTLHFVGSFVEGGATFCSSRTGRCKPFAYVLGEASAAASASSPTAGGAGGPPIVVKGWDRALPRVPLGGVARVTLPPQVGARSNLSSRSSTPAPPPPPPPLAPLLLFIRRDLVRALRGGAGPPPLQPTEGARYDTTALARFVVAHSLCCRRAVVSSSCLQLAFGKFGRGRYGFPGHVPPTTAVR
jgi:FKBP-type peptidyl-prolyl cis-trans isomerase